MSPRRNRIAAAAAGVLSVGVGGLLFGCDKVYADPVTVPPSSARGFDAGAGVTATRNPPVACPKIGNENSPCKPAGTVCEYGDSPDPTCNSHFVCANDVTHGASWTEQARPSCSACPADPSTIVDGAPCNVADAGTGDEVELQCTTALGTCGCTTGADGAHAHPRRWVCVVATSDCPSKRPLLGQPCFGERACDYGACEFKRGVRMICEDEVWQVEVASCK